MPLAAKCLTEHCAWREKYLHGFPINEAGIRRVSDVSGPAPVHEHARPLLGELGAAHTCLWRGSAAATRAQGAECRATPAGPCVVLQEAVALDLGRKLAYVAGKDKHNRPCVVVVGGNHVPQVGGREGGREGKVPRVKPRRE